MVDTPRPKSLGALFFMCLPRRMILPSALSEDPSSLRPRMTVMLVNAQQYNPRFVVAQRFEGHQ
jgi:hypothetical protein